MKRGILILAVLACAVPALAQFGGMPIATGADPMEAMSLRASGGLVFGDDFNLYGVRGTVSPIKGLAAFGDAGVIDPDIGDLGWALQAGGLFSMPLDLPVDVGLRGTVGLAGYDFDGGTARFKNINGGVLASKKIEILTPYAFMGINYVKATLDVDGLGDVDDDDTDLALAGGAVLTVNEQLSFYGEIDYIDDPFFAAGARFDF